VDVGLEIHKFPEEMKENLLKKFEKLPKGPGEKLRSIVESLSTQDIGTMNPAQLMSLILNEYDIELG